MKLFVVTLIFLFMFLNFCHAQNLIIQNVTTVNPIDNNKVETLKHQWVQIKNGRIEKISSSGIATTGQVKVIDGTGKFLIPGLMDSHVHTKTMPGLKRGVSNHQRMQQTYWQQQPRSYLYYGITQILDPSSTQEHVDNFHAEGVTPDMFYCGAAPIVGGYNLLEADLEQAIKRRKYFIHQPDIDGRLPVGFDPKQHTPERVLERMAKDGAVCVKVYTEDGFDTASNWPSISGELLNRVRAAATKHGLIMMSHSNAVDMQEIAIAADVDVLGHGLWNWLHHSSVKGLPLAVKNVADKILAKNMVYQPTLNVMRSLRDITVEGHLHHHEYRNVVSPEALNWYQSEEGQWFSKVVFEGWEERGVAPFHRRMTAVLNQGERVLQYLYQKGHPLVLATDTPPAPAYASQPGLSSYWELESMNKLGVSLPRLLAAATINNAKAFKLDEDYGSLHQGKVANLLLLESNPIEHIEAYNQIDMVILRGAPHNRDKFKVKLQNGDLNR